MIEVVYNGGLGNNLFQYCFGRILAEKLGYQLKAQPIPGFEGTYESVEGASYPGLAMLTLRGQRPDLSFLDNPTGIKRHILLTGYFQRYEYYKSCSLQIKEWLRLDDRIDASIGENDIGLSIRRGRDYIPQYGLPLSFYERALDSTSFSNVYICTNEPDDRFVTYLAKKYRAVIRPGGFQGGKLGSSYLADAIDNLIFLKKFKKLIISNSSFAWWAAFLSEAQEIYYPRPSTGMWAPVASVSKNLDLEVDEERYRYIECEPYRSQFLSEIVRVQIDRTGKNIRSAANRVLGPLRPARQQKTPVYRFEEE